MSVLFPETGIVARLVELAHSKPRTYYCERTDDEYIEAQVALEEANAALQDAAEDEQERLDEAEARPVHISHTTSVTLSRVNTDPWRPALSPTQVFDTRSIVLPGVITFSEETGKGFSVHGWNDEVMRQLGRGLAHVRHTIFHIDTQFDGESLPPSVYTLARDGELRQLRVSVYSHVNEHGVKQPVALTEVWDADKAAWKTHPITHRSRKAAIRVCKHGWVTAYTKYHFIAVLLQNSQLGLDKPIIVRTQNPEMARRFIFDGYIRELWKLAGYDYRQFRMAKELFS